jgi:antitoxin MazE
MQVSIRTIGNSKGVVLPKPLLAQVGLEKHTCAEIKVEGNTIILSKPVKDVRAGWAQAAQAIAAHGDDVLVMGEFSNTDDKDLEW